VLLRVLERAAVLVAGLLVSSILVFAFMAVLPGDPARTALGVNATEQAVTQLREQFGLDRPLPVQYLDWIGGLLRGDLGTSYISKALIGPQVADRLQVTLWLVVTSMVLAVIVAVPAGVLMAVRHRRLSGVVLSAASQVGVAVPAFLAGILLVTLFAVRLRWLPANGYVRLRDDPGQWAAHLVLPVVALAVVQASVLVRYVRSAILDVLHEDYLRTARAVGWTRLAALYRHGLRNASLSLVTVVGLQLATLFVGAIVIEQVFALPGLGQLLLSAVGQRDLVLVQGTVMVLVLAVLVINALVDLSYLALDPRLRAGGAR
jgi:peptide/nickel transport system permease protein